MTTAIDTLAQTTWIQHLREMPFAQRKRMVLYCSLFIAILSLAPRSMLPEAPIPLPFLDKFVHFGMYATLAGLSFWSIRPTQQVCIRTIPVFGGSFAYGVLLELLQRYLTVLHRSFSQGDIVANGAGAAACLVVLGWRTHGVRAAIPLMLFLQGSIQ